MFDAVFDAIIAAVAWVAEMLAAVLSALIELIAGLFVESAADLGAGQLLLWGLVAMLEMLIWACLGLFALLLALCTLRRPVAPERPRVWRPQPRQRTDD